MTKLKQCKSVLMPIAWSALAYFGATNARADGVFDTSFVGTGHALVDVSSGPKDVGTVMHILPNGKILMAGTCYLSEPTSNGSSLFPFFCATQLNANGSYDTSFGPGGVGYLRFDRFHTWPNNSIVTEAIRLADGRTALVGSWTDSTSIMLAVLTPDGSALDPGTAGGAGFFTWQYNGATSYASSMVQQPDGKILVAGTTPGPNGNFDMAIKRFLPDFSIDTNFGTGGYQTVAFDLGGPSGDNTDQVKKMVLQPDGGVVLVGLASTTSPVVAQIAVARLLPSGQLDTSFGPNHDGRMHFGSDVINIAQSVAIDVQGRIDIVGATLKSSSDTNPHCLINRLLVNGSQDPSFNATSGEGSGQPQLFYANPSGGTNLGCVLNDVVSEPDGSLMAVGSALRDSTGATSYFAAVRLTPSGAFDEDFGDLGKTYNAFGATLSASSIDNGNAVAIYNGGLMIGGASTDAAGDDTKFGIARLILDTIFSNGFEQ